MRFASIWRWAVSLALAVGLATAEATLFCAPRAQAQEPAKAPELARKVKTKVWPVYPDAARRLNLSGSVRLAVVVAPNGSVKSSKALGGHPILVNAAMDAMKQWKFEAGPTESSGTVEFRFQPQD